MNYKKYPVEVARIVWSEVDNGRTYPEVLGSHPGLDSREVIGKLNKLRYLESNVLKEIELRKLTFSDLDSSKPEFKILRLAKSKMNLVTIEKIVMIANYCSNANVAEVVNGGNVFSFPQKKHRNSTKSAPNNISSIESDRHQISTEIAPHDKLTNEGLTRSDKHRNSTEIAPHDKLTNEDLTRSDKHQISTEIAPDIIRADNESLTSPDVPSINTSGLVREDSDKHQNSTRSAPEFVRADKHQISTRSAPKDAQDISLKFWFLKIVPTAIFLVLAAGLLVKTSMNVYGDAAAGELDWLGLGRAVVIDCGPLLILFFPTKNTLQGFVKWACVIGAFGLAVSTFYSQRETTVASVKTYEADPTYKRHKESILSHQKNLENLPENHTTRRSEIQDKIDILSQKMESIEDKYRDTKEYTANKTRADVLFYGQIFMMIIAVFVGHHLVDLLKEPRAWRKIFGESL